MVDWMNLIWIKWYLYAVNEENHLKYYYYVHSDNVECKYDENCDTIYEDDMKLWI